MRAWLVAMILLAGCAGEVPGDATVDEAPPPGPVRLAGDPLLQNATNSTAWGTLALQADGDAGAWIVVYEPFAALRETVATTIRFHLTAQGPDAIVFAVPPGFVYGEGEDAFLRIAPVFGGDNMMRGDDVEYVYDISYGSRSDIGMAGVLFAATASAPWTLDVRVDIDDGGAPSPLRHVVTGDGATFAWGAERQLPAGGVDMLAFTSSHDTAGWSHLEVLRDPVQPVGVRDQDFRLPGGATYQAMGTMTGYDTYVLAASASAGGYAEVFGDLHDDAGAIEARLTLAEADLDIDMASTHIPIDELPPSLGSGVYRGSKWPFSDGIPGTVTILAASASEMESLIR